MRGIAILALIVACPSIVVAADPLVGDKVFVKEGALTRNGDTKVELERVFSVAAVKVIERDWLLVGQVWVRSSDVMSADEALAAYGDQIQLDPMKALPGETALTSGSSATKRVGRWWIAIERSCLIRMTRTAMSRGLSL